MTAHGKTQEQILEEEQSLRMHVGAGQACLRWFDVDDQDMGLGETDVVLEDESLAAACGGGAQSRVIEL